MDMGHYNGRFHRREQTLYTTLYGLTDLPHTLSHMRRNVALNIVGGIYFIQPTSQMGETGLAPSSSQLTVSGINPAPVSLHHG